MLKMKKTAFAVVATLLAATSAWSQDPVLNLYSARHYSTDEALYANFTKTTGIKINRVDADDAGILARLKAEGAASPADVILLVDAARLWKGEIEGLFQPVRPKSSKRRFPPRCAPNPPAKAARPGSACRPGPA
jgi:iron(III) transport system substrate-binding protein